SKPRSLGLRPLALVRPGSWSMVSTHQGRMDSGQTWHRGPRTKDDGYGDSVPRCVAALTEAEFAGSSFDPQSQPRETRLAVLYTCCTRHSAGPRADSCTTVSARVAHRADAQGE